MELALQDTRTGEITRRWELLPKQAEFFLSEKRFTLFSGGFGAGKTLALILKALIEAWNYPGNYGLLGRLQYQELRDTLQAEFIDVIPKDWIRQYIKSEKKLVFQNDSVIIFRHLDSVSKEEIKSLNLGFVAIDQVEDIPYETFLGLRGRLRRLDKDGKPYPHKIMMTANPANTWLFREFKQNSDPENHLIESSTYDNPHLPKSFISDLEKYPKQWREQFMEGRWDTAVMGDKSVFAKQFLDEQLSNLIPEDRAKKLDDIRIYREPVKEHFYQMGIDPSEGSGSDSSVISLVDLVEGEEVAFWRGKIQPDLLAYKAKQLADYFNKSCKNRVLIVPETNGIGAALLAQLKKVYPLIYQREVFMKKQKEYKMILGWKTTISTKPLLITNLQQLMREKKVTLHTPELLEEFRTFEFTDEVRKHSMGAARGFHDDCVIAAMLGFFAPPYVATRVLHERNRQASLFKPTYHGNTGSLWDIPKSTYNWKTDA